MPHLSNRSKKARLLDLLLSGESDDARIADLIGMTPGTIQATRSELRADGYPIPIGAKGAAARTCRMRLTVPLDAASRLNAEAMRLNMAPADLAARLIQNIVDDDLWAAVLGDD